MQNLMPPVDTSDNAFHDGDPTTGQLGTIVTAEWLNNVQGATRDTQAEIIAVLTKAGMQPNPQKKNQLAEAIGLIIGSGDYVTNSFLKLELLKKFDKADISQQLGNDTGKVPSLNLLVNELGKKAGVADVNGKLTKDQNGADIPDKPKFIENLGLQEKGNYADKSSFVAQNFSSAISTPELRVTDEEGAAAFNKIEGVAHRKAKGDWNFFNYPEKSGVGALLSDIPDAAKILELLLMVDGTGSGIDADYVRGLPADFSSSLSANGYQKLPSGLIVQWGVTEQTNAPLWTPFNVAFPNKCIFISIEDREGGTNLQLWQKNTVVNNGFSAHPICRIEAPGKFTGVTASAAPWLALGF